MVADMCPSNIILFNRKKSINRPQISLIDLEGFASFDWFFEGKPQEWEAQDRNLKKCPDPLWRDMSKYTVSFLKECVGINYKKSIDCVERFEEVYELVKEL